MTESAFTSKAGLPSVFAAIPRPEGNLIEAVTKINRSIVHPVFTSSVFEECVQENKQIDIIPFVYCYY